MLCREELRVHANDEHFFVVTAIEDRDTAALGELRRRPPQEVVRELASARLLEGSHVQTGRVYAREDVANRAVLARCIERLKHQEHCETAVGEETMLRFAERLHFCREQLFPIAFGFTWLRRSVAGIERTVIGHEQRMAFGRKHGT